jgi:hypothetical protein
LDLMSNYFDGWFTAHNLKKYFLTP